MITRRTLQPSFSLLALPLATFSALFLLAAPSSIFAQKNWVGPNPDNDWFTPANWSPTGAPALTDDTAIGNDTQATIALPGATTQDLDLGVLRPGTLNVNGTGELTAGGNVFVGGSDDGTLNITGGGTVRHPGFDGTIGNAAGTTGVATVTGAGSNWLLHNLVIGNFGHGTLNILNGGLVTGFDAFIAQKDNSTGLAVVNGAGGASSLQLGGNFFVGGDATGAHGTGVLRVLNGGIVNSNRLVVLSTGTLEIGVNPMITVTNAAGIEYDGGTLKTIADTTLTDNGSLQTGGVILDSNGFTSTLSGIYSGTGGVTKIGTGTLTLSGTNTYSGGTTINAGTLVVGSADALGTGNVFLSDGTLQTQSNNPRGFNVRGNYSQDFGTLRMQIGGTNTGVNSDLMIVGGTATFSMGDSSTLFLHRIFNFNPLPGEMVTIIDTGNPITTTFDHVTNDFPGLIQPLVIYNANDVTVDFELSATFASQALTPNQTAVGNAIDHAFADLCLSNTVLGIVGSIPVADLPHAFDLIAPEELAAMYEMSFSRAVVQSANLQGRMDQIRANADPDCGPIVEINPAPEGKNVVGKNVVPPAPAPDNRLGTFAMGSGQYVTVHNQDDNADGYRITNGSFLAGLDYRLLHNLAIGVYGGYVGSEADLVGGGRIVTDGGTVGGYATFFSHGFYLQAAGGGGGNSYDNLRAALLGTAHGKTNGSELNAMGAFGYDWTMNFNAANHPGSLTVGPIASVQYTNVDIDGYSETGSLIPLEFPDQSEDSLRSTIGGKLAICIQTDHGIMLRPEVRVAWLHEYNDRSYPIDARFIGCPDIFTVHGPVSGQDAAQVNAGVTVQFNPMVALFAHYDGLFGRDNYHSNSVSGGLALSF